MKKNLLFGLLLLPILFCSLKDLSSIDCLIYDKPYACPTCGKIVHDSSHTCREK